MKMMMEFGLIKKLKYRLNNLLDRWRYGFLDIPGMMGYDERMNLFKTCRDELSGKGVAVEFGAFFGASTSAIQQGLKKNKHDILDIEFHVVDCFRSALTSDFSELVRLLARQGNIENLLYEEDGWLCFDQAFLRNIERTDPNLKIHQVFLSDFLWESKPVEFLHLDLPKDWKLAYPIASTIFPDLIPGARVLFQDFGYQWSAELIAMVGALIEIGTIKPYSITDTTLSVIVVKSITHDDVETLNAMLSVPENVISAIEVSRAACINFSESADATALMAKAQYQYTHGDAIGSYKSLEAVLHHNSFSKVTRERMADLFGKAFVPDKSYEKVEEQGVI